VPPRPPELRPYRTFVYAVFVVFCAVLFTQLVRSVTSDVFSRELPDGGTRPATAAACLEDVERLYALLSARAVQSAPGGLDDEKLALDWDGWVRRWEADVAEVSRRCMLDHADEAPRRDLAVALDGLENLRRGLSTSGAESGKEARRVKDALAAARASLKLKQSPRQ